MSRHTLEDRPRRRARLASLGATLLALAMAAATLSGAPAARAGEHGGQPGVRIEQEPSAPLDNTVLVTPTQVALDDLQPGSTHTIDVTVRNRRLERAAFELAVVGVIGSDDPSRSVEFLDDDDERMAATAVTWIEPLVDRFALDPREAGTVQVRVRVPEDAAPGGHYAALAVRQRTADVSGQGATLGVQSEVAVVMLATVPGEVRREFELRRVDASRTIVGRTPWELLATVHNTGNTHLRATGIVQVRSVFGSTVARFPIASRIVLPQAAGAAPAEWTGTPWLGIYRYDLRLQPDGEEGPVRRADGWLFVLPPLWMVAMLLAVLIVAVVAWRRRVRDDDGFDDGDDAAYGHEEDTEMDALYDGLSEETCS